MALTHVFGSRVRVKIRFVDLWQVDLLHFFLYGGNALTLFLRYLEFGGKVYRDHTFKARRSPEVRSGASFRFWGGTD